MTARERVDVAVVTWNTAELTATSLRRLLDSDQGCDLRVLVRDNASADGTVERLARDVPEAVVDAGHDNLGFAGGVNTIIERSDAPWLFLLNSDAWPEPGAIGRLVETAKRHPEAAAVAPRLVDPGGSLEHSTYPFPSVRLAAALALGHERIPPDRAERMMLVGAWRHDRERAVDWAIGAALLIPREALVDVGPFDDRFFMYVEDLDWCWRARTRGWEIRFDPAAKVVHVGNASGAQAYGDRRTAAYMANTYRFFRREHGLIAATAYRGLNVLAAARRLAKARRSGDRDAAAYWRRQLSAHVRAENGRPERGAGIDPEAFI